MVPDTWYFSRQIHVIVQQVLLVYLDFVSDFFNHHVTHEVPGQHVCNIHSLLKFCVCVALCHVILK